MFKSNGLKILDVIKPHKQELQAIHEFSLITNCPIFSQQATNPQMVWMGRGGGGTNVSCPLKFWLFVSCQLNDC